MRLVYVSLPCVLMVLSTGCASGGRNPKHPTSCPPGQTFDGTYCVTPSSIPIPPASSSPSPTATPSNTATTPPPGSAPLEKLPELIQAHVASGAQPLAAPITGNVGAGQSLEVPLQLNPGQCYTAVSAASPGVQELEVTLEAITPVPGSSPVLAVDKDQGPTAVMAPQPNCYKWAVPVGTPAKVVVKATAGSGAAVVQVFVK